MANPGRRSEATTPGGSIIHPSCTPKGRSGEHTVSPYICIFQSITASAHTSCVSRCAPTGCNATGSDTGGVVTTFLRPRLTMLRPFRVGMSVETGGNEGNTHTMTCFTITSVIINGLAHSATTEMRNINNTDTHKTHLPRISSPGMRTIYTPDRQKPRLAHTSSPEGRSMVNPRRRSEATTPGVSLIHLPCTPKGRSGEHTVSPYIYIFQSITASAHTSCVSRCAPTGCNATGSDTGGVVTAFLRPRLSMLRPFGVGISANADN